MFPTGINDTTTESAGNGTFPALEVLNVFLSSKSCLSEGEQLLHQDLAEDYHWQHEVSMQISRCENAIEWGSAMFCLRIRTIGLTSKFATLSERCHVSRPDSGPALSRDARQGWANLNPAALLGLQRRW